MHSAFSALHHELNLLKDTIDNAQISEDTFLQQYGWSHTALDSSDLSYAVQNLISDLEIYHYSDDDNCLTYLMSQAAKIKLLNGNIQSHFISEGSYLVYVVPNVAITIMMMHQDLDKMFLSWDKIQEGNLLPRHLTRRIQSTEARLSAIDSSCVNVEEKVTTINNAHEAAENLPTDLEELKTTHKQIKELLNEAKEIFSEIQLREKTAEVSINIIQEFEESARLNKEQTEKYVAECDDALQITTTQGLAAGFDQKAEELSQSITNWVRGLIFALILGGVLGGFRVHGLTEMLSSNQEISLGEGFIQTALTIFSIGGPLWFAWLATQQITQRFKLSEDYSYKATVAKSFTGFNKQAHRFGPEVEERLFNATLDRLEEMPLRLVEGKDYNSPWHEFMDSDVVKQVISTVPEFARELKIYAKNTNRKVPDRSKNDNDISNVTPIEGMDTEIREKEA